MSTTPITPTSTTLDAWVHPHGSPHYRIVSRPLPGASTRPLMPPATVFLASPTGHPHTFTAAPYNAALVARVVELRKLVSDYERWLQATEAELGRARDYIGACLAHDPRPHSRPMSADFPSHTP